MNTNSHEKRALKEVTKKLLYANKKLVFQNIENDKRAAELIIADRELSFQSIIDFLPDATLAVDKERRVIIWNKAIEKMTGIPATEMIGNGDYTYTKPFYGKARPMLLDSLFLSDEELLTQYPKITREGDALIAEIFCPALYNNKGAWLFVKVSPLHDQTGNILGAIESLRDITERKKAQDILKLSEEKYSNYIENAPDGVFVIDENGHYIEVNKACSEMTGYSKDELLQMTISDLLTEESQEVGKQHFNNLLEKGFARGTLQHKHKDGTKIWLTVDAVKLTENRFLGFAKDTTYQKKVEEQILYISYHDQLTGLYNRRFYEKELKILDTKRNLPLTIVMGGVNGLKLINDSFGHVMGDELLRKAAEVIKNGCRADDIIARLGGDEFVILLPKTDALGAEQIIERIKDLSLKEKVGNVDISISVGYATKSIEEENIQEIFSYAEDLMYRHKRSESSGIRTKTVDLVMNTLYKKSNREQLHSIKVSEICEAIATKMNFSESDIYQIKLAGLMHDIGKIEIDEKILNKPEKLSKDEWGRMQRHPEMGYRILSSVNEFSIIADDVLEHHERWDGKGYPRSLKGEEISLRARIIAVADSYDAMTSDRTYGKALSEAEAINEIRRCSGTQFDPEVARAFVEKVLGQEW